MPKKPAPRTDERVTYRELRNTPGRVWERLAANEALTLVAEGVAKAILVPVEDGDVRSAYEAWTRGRAMLAATRMRRSARESGANNLTLNAINAQIRSARAARRRSADRD